MADDGPPAAPVTPPAPSPAAPSDPPEPRRIAGGFTVREYEVRVWDMARHVLHPTGLYIVAVVAGCTRLLAHPLLDEPGTGAAIELALFLAGFLGAWACFLSTLLRDAGLPSLTVSILVPFTALAALVVWFVLPRPGEMTPATFTAAAIALAGPGPLAWVFTMIRWRRERAAHIDLLPEADR